MESITQLIAALEDDNMFGLEAPPEATSWTAAQIVAFFESDGEQLPPDVVDPSLQPAHTEPEILESATAPALFSWPQLCDSPKRRRILCFHSFRLSGQILANQISMFSNVGQVLEDADLVYIDGAHRVSPEKEARMPEMLKSMFEGPYFEWWDANPVEQGVSYDGLDSTLEYIQQFMAEHGPFDGFLGFSQGGSLVHLLCTLISKSMLQIPAPRFVIVISAMRSRHYAHNKLMESVEATPLQIPALVMMGGKDTEVSHNKTRQLIETLGDHVTEIFLPEGKHQLPRLNPDEVRTCKEFLARH